MAPDKFKHNVERMRYYQKKFFSATPGTSIRNEYLRKAKQFEAIIDKHLENPNQTSLFE